MVGREMRLRRAPRTPPRRRPARAVLDVARRSAARRATAACRRWPASTSRCARGEILGIAGVAGNGQRELAEVITGLRAATGGQVRIGGRD